MVIVSWLTHSWLQGEFLWCFPTKCCSCFSVVQSCPFLCDPMDCSMPSFHVLSPSPGACSNSCPLCRGCHPTISSSVTPFSSCLQSFPASGSFSMSWLFTSGGQSIGDSSSASVLPMNNQDWFPLGLTGYFSLLSKGLSRILSSTIVQKHQFFGAQPFFVIQLSHPYINTGKTITLTIWTFVDQVTYLLFNTLSLSYLFFQGASIC